MLRILAALTVCYFAGTVAGRSLLPYRIGDPASNFKNDIDNLAHDSFRLTSPDAIRGSVTGLALDGSRRTLDTMGVRH
jgi:hypothetical protein